MAKLTEMQMNGHLGSRAWAEGHWQKDPREGCLWHWIGVAGYRCSAGRTGLYCLCGREVGDQPRETAGGWERDDV